MLDELMYRLPDSAFVTAWVAAVGLVVGSYLNVVVYRLPAGLSTVRPGSRCPRCLSPIRPFDNIPVLSFLLLAGRCRRCRMRISWRYPAVEAVTSVLFVSVFRLFPGRPLVAVAGALLCCTWLVLGLIDWDLRLVPLPVIVPALVLLLVAQPWLAWVSWLDAWLGSMVGAVALATVGELWRFRTGDPGFAAGDLWGIALVGAAWGWQGAVVVFAVAAALGVLAAAWMRLGGDSRDSLPFVSFLALAGLGIHVLWPAWT